MRERGHIKVGATLSAVVVGLAWLIGIGAVTAVAVGAGAMLATTLLALGLVLALRPDGRGNGKP